MNTNNSNTQNTVSSTPKSSKTSNKSTKTVTTSAAAPAATTTTSAPARGLRKPEVVAMLKNFKFPSEPFTIKQACTALGADHWLIHNYVKANGKIVGDAPKAAGPNGKTRGKAAKLYQLPADKLVF